MAIIQYCPVVVKEELNHKYIRLGFQNSEMATEAKPGQFVNVQISEACDPLLKRPISIHRVDQDNGIIYLLFKVVGQGTKILSQIQVGTKIQVVGPLGTGFDVTKGEQVLLIGGGIGVAPLYELAVELRKQGNRIRVVLGLTDEDDLVLVEQMAEFEPMWIVVKGDSLTTRQGLVTELVEEELTNNLFNQIYTCGPHPMLKALQGLLGERLKDTQFSMEEKMGCGIGLCFSCTCKVKEKERSDEWSNERICTRGPVFRGDEVIL